jgi:ABC-type sulfate transport system substrate-binding protein
MGLSVNKHIEYNGQEYTGYEIVGVEWIFTSDTFNVMTEYFYKAHNKNIRKLVKHNFKVGNDVDVDGVINMVHKLHI